jgi:protein-L-isoaspartate(D-aspartate) O-methyltransferase
MSAAANCRRRAGTIWILMGEDMLIMRTRLFMPVGERDNQYIYVIDKKEDGSVEKNRLYGVRYVPLTDAPPE